MEVGEPSAKYLVRSRYKQTEGGEIPEDWTLKSIADLAVTVASGRSSVDSEFGDFPVHGSTGMIGRSTKGEYSGKAILVARVGANAGTLNIVDGEYGVTDNTIILRIGESVLWSYVWRQLDAKRLNSMVFGSGQPLITGSQIKSLLIPVPPTKAEQNAIAETLNDADALIESLEQLLAKKRQIKQGAMQELLTGKRRLPGFGAEWKESRLGAVGRFLKGAGVAKDESLTGSIRCIRYGEIYTRHNDYIKEFHSWISREVAAAATQLVYGDILFAGSGETKEEIGKCVAFVDDVEAYAGSDIVILRPAGADSLFLGYYLNTASVSRQKASRGQGDAVVHIAASALGDIQVSVPSLKEQSAIAAILSDMDIEITELEAKLTKARLIKQGMMQELLTGRIRLI